MQKFVIKHNKSKDLAYNSKEGVKKIRLKVEEYHDLLNDTYSLQQRVKELEAELENIISTVFNI